MISTAPRCVAAGLLLLAGAGSGALAETGDVYQITSPKVNLRAGASDSAAIITTVAAGDEVIELDRDGAWIGVRVLHNGEEGWIYGELAEQVMRSRLQPGDGALAVGDLSDAFATLIDSIDALFGYPVVERLNQSDDGTLRLTPTRDWLLYAGQEAHLMTTVAFYQAWKARHRDRPVTVFLNDREGRDYISVRDGDRGPRAEVLPAG